MFSVSFLAIVVKKLLKLFPIVTGSVSILLPFLVSMIFSFELFLWAILLICLCIFFILSSAANKDYSSAGHHEQKNKKTTGQIKFLAITIKQQIKLVLWHSLCKYEINVYSDNTQ